MQLFKGSGSLVNGLWRVPFEPLRTALVDAVAVIFYVFDVQGCRRAVLPAIRLAFPMAGLWAASMIGMGATRSSLRFSIEAMSFLKLKPAALRQRFLCELRVEGLEHLEQALVKGQGVLLAYSNFSCYYLGLLALAHSGNASLQKLCFLQPNLGPLAEAVLQKINHLVAPKRVQHIHANTPRTGIDLLAALRGGEAVACPVDNVSDGGLALGVSFLGQQTPYPAGIFGLAAKNMSTVVPMHVERVGRRHCVRFGQPIAAREGLALSEQMQGLAQGVADHFTRITRRCPGKWESWRTLGYRWGQQLGSST
jgi:lauroyl/myristoyl acyltransferase